jgi:iron complex outermembrane receptor protein
MDPRWNRRHSVKRLFSIPLPSIAAVLLGVIFQFPPKAGGAALVEFHIAAGDATLTLNEFSRQAHVQLLWDFNVVKGRVTQAVDGLYEPRDALRHMLGNTGLVFAVVNERTLAVTPMRSASRPSGTAAPPAAHSRPPQEPNNQSLAQRPGSAETEPATAADTETVRITGTHLSGEAPVGANVLDFDREALDDSGVSTVADFMRTLPQVFGGGPTQDTHLVGSEAPTNSGYGTGINLRGLGARATLVLINGRRIAPGGTDGEFVDIENIPLSAVERIEVLPDSASALYGADAVGGVVNYIMRDNFTGAETTLGAGTGTQNSLKNYLVSQTLGQKWDDVSGMISLEFYRRDALPASDRSYAVSNLTPFGGSDFDTYLTNPGNLVANGVTYAIPKGQDGTHLSASSLVPGTLNEADRYLDTDILPEQQRWSLYSSGRANPTDRLSLFANVLVSTREATERTGGEMASLLVPSTNPFYVNPMGGTAPVIVQYNFADDLGVDVNDVRVNATNATVGLDFDAGASWKINAYGGFARETENQSQTGVADLSAVEAALADPDPATAFNPFGDGSHTNPQTLSTLTTPYRYRGASQLEMADITADGPLWQLPGGPVKLGIGLDERNESFDSDTPASAIAPASDVRLSRRTTAAFAELVLPLFGKDNGLPGLRRLELSGAARYEDYSNFGHDTTPKVGLVWAPVTDLSFRGTWSRSIRPPSLNDLDESRNVVQPYPLADPRSPSGETVALIWSGNNAQLREERARTWTTGLDFSPEGISGLTVGLTWFNIDFNDRIEDTLFSPDMLTNPQYSGLVTFNPNPTLIGDVCTHSIPVGLTQSECMALGAAGAIIDLRVHNLETLRTQGLDFDTHYEIGGRYGRLKFELNGTYLAKFSLAEGNGSPTTDVLNLQNNPINLRLKGTIRWSGARLGYALSLNYSNSYRDTLTVPNMPVAAWTTIDAQVSYRLGALNAGPFDNTQIELDAFNVFNRDPPFLNNAAAGIGYDQENADPYGRMLSLLIRKNW